MEDEQLDRQAFSEALQELGRIVITEHTLDELLGQVVTLARRAIRRADGVSATLVRDHEPFTSHATDDVVSELDRLQYTLHSGPCVEAFESGESVVFSVEHDPRFHEFATSARERFMTSVLSVPMIAEDNTIGALNIYSANDEELSEVELEVSSLFAGQAAALVANAAAYATSSQEKMHLQRALERRDLIGQAKGILMERDGCSADEAFDQLRRRSQETNEKLIDVARRIVAEVSGEG